MRFLDFVREDSTSFLRVLLLANASLTVFTIGSGSALKDPIILKKPNNSAVTFTGSWTGS